MPLKEKINNLIILLRNYNKIDYILDLNIIINKMVRLMVWHFMMVI